MKRAPGFTLIELLAACAVIGILLGLVFPAMQAARSRGTLEATRLRYAEIGQALIAYRTHYGVFPELGGTEEGFNVSEHPRIFYEMLCGDAPEGGSPSSTGLRLNPERHCFRRFSPEEWDTDADCVMDPRGNSSIHVRFDVDGDGRLRGNELRDIPVYGVRESVPGSVAVFCEADAGVSPIIVIF